MLVFNFPAPDPLNGKQLAAEVEAAGYGPVEVSFIPDAEGGPQVCLRGASLTMSASAVVAAHVGAVPPAQLNEAALRLKAETALALNSEFLGLAGPTQAQTLAQVKMLTKECSALIRLFIRKFDSMEGT